MIAQKERKILAQWLKVSDARGVRPYPAAIEINKEVESMIHHHSSGKHRLLKRIFSMCIALIMICGIAVPSFAVSANDDVGSTAAGASEPAVTYNFYVEPIPW